MHMNAAASGVQSLKYGVPQGSVLGPLLFSIYIIDLPLIIKACCDRFADDTTIHTSDSDPKQVSESLLESVNSLIEWMELNHMSLHPSKTKFMLYHHYTKETKFDFEVPAYIDQKPNCGRNRQP